MFADLGSFSLMRWWSVWPETSDGRGWLGLQRGGDVDAAAGDRYRDHGRGSEAPATMASTVFAHGVSDLPPLVPGSCHSNWSPPGEWAAYAPPMQASKGSTRWLGTPLGSLAFAFFFATSDTPGSSCMFIFWYGFSHNAGHEDRSPFSYNRF